MTLDSAATFAAAFFVLAITPGPGVALILSRTLGSGLAGGLAITTGLLIGDFILMGVAMLGMSAIANAAGPLFQIVKYAGAVYLLWLGYQAFAAPVRPIEVERRTAGAAMREIGLGVFVMMGNPKPILFYGALMPTLLDVAAIRVPDYLVLCAIVTVIAYTVYGGYMLLVERARQLMISASALRRLNQVTGTMFVGSGILVAAR